MVGATPEGSREMPQDFHPKPGDLPAEIAVFPLPGALLLPWGRLPLNIFEPRYLNLVTDALANGRMFGMIQPDPHKPRVEDGAGLYRVGCLGRLTQFAETEDGRMLITLHGVTRFRVVEELPLHGGYRRVRADYQSFADDLAQPPSSLGLDREALTKVLKAFFRSHGIDANWDAIEEMPDPLLVNSLGMVCPFGTAEKQALLEAPSLPDRAAMLHALLEMGAHERQTDDGASHIVS